MDYEKFLRNWTDAQPVVASYIGAMVPDFQAAEDLLQDVAVVLMKKFADYDPTRPFVPWALGVARFEILSRKRSHARSFIAFNGGILDRVTQAYAEAAPELEHRTGLLRECLADVQGRPREVLRLRYVENMKPGEIAERLGTAPAAMRTMLSRIRSKLRDCIERKQQRLRP